MSAIRIVLFACYVKRAQETFFAFDKQSKMVLGSFRNTD